MHISCLFGFHDWVYDSTVVRSCGSELQKVYRCLKCRKYKYMNCDTNYKGCENFKFPMCKYHTDVGEECPKMKRKRK